VTRSEDPIVANEVESAWPDHSKYRIDITPVQPMTRTFDRTPAAMGRDNRTAK